MVLKIILGVILALILITAIRAIFFVPKKSEKAKGELPDEAVDVEQRVPALDDAHHHRAHLVDALAVVRDLGIHLQLEVQLL